MRQSTLQMSRLVGNRPTPSPSQEGSRFVRVPSVPLLGGVRGGLKAPMRAKNSTAVTHALLRDFPGYKGS